MILQAATEAVKSTSNIALDGVAIMALITAGGLAAREYFKSRRGRANGNGNGRGPKPGSAPKCIEHGEKLIRLETEHINICGDITEMKGDIKTLLQRIPPRE
jgi:hypothetical protein